MEIEAMSIENSGSQITKSEVPVNFWLRVSGKPMEPEYFDGDMIFVEPDRQPLHNSDVVVKTTPSSKETFRRLQTKDGSRYLVALNPSISTPSIPVTEELKICGVVSFSGKVRC